MTEYIVKVDDESDESIIEFLGCKPIKTISALVRCRDCKHYDEEHKVCCVYVSFRLAKDEDEYCSDGEMREEE